MKKVTYLLFAAAGLLLATSCVRDADEFAASGESEVTIQAQLPADFATRAIGDGTQATTLTYAVYDKAQTQGPVICVEDAEDVTFVGNKASLTLRLATGHSYDIIFWADAAVAEGASNPYTFDQSNKTITVNYDGATANDESRDAFFGQIEGLEVNGTVNQTVTLTRPFAQLNLGTDDAAAAEALGVTIAKSSVKVANVCTTLNLLDGTAQGASEVTFAAAAVPTEQLAVGGKTYGYLGMNYVLVPAAEAGDVLTNCTITLNDGNDLPEIALNSVPLKRNYRTNILGSLITSPADFNINIDKAFAGDIEFKVVNTTEDLIQAMEDGGKYRLAENIELTTLPAITNDLEMDLGGKTLTLSSQYSLAPNADVIFTNGSIEAPNKPANRAAIGVGAGKTATFEGVDFTTSGVAIYPSSDATVVIRDSKITAMNSYAVSTNASNATAASAPANITIEGNTVLEGNSPVLVNMPCNLKMTGVTVNGGMHGIVIRGGTAVIEDCTVTLTYSEDETEAEAQGMANYFASLNWGEGNTLNLAALTVGNKGPVGQTSYQYPTNVTIKNSTFRSVGTHAALFPALYGWANSAEGMGVTIEYDDATTFTNGTDKPIVFGSENITVNGVAVTL